MGGLTSILPGRAAKRLRDFLKNVKRKQRLRNRVAGDPAFTEMAAKWGLQMDEVGKLKMLADLRNDSLEFTFHRTIRNLLAAVPTKILDRNVLRELDLASVVKEEGLVKVTLRNGRVFYNYPSRLRYVMVYHVFCDLIPREFGPETYQAGVDVLARYSQGGGGDKWFPGPGGVVIEGGAYIGLKAVRYAERVGPNGKVIAIEIGQENFELLKRNIRVNDMQHVITPVHCGIWNTTGEMDAAFEYSNWYHLATPDEHDFVSRSERVPTQTLDDIIDGHNLNVVDYLNLQLNGAELEGLEGLDRRLRDVKIIRTAAYYTRQGVPQVDAVRQLLEKKGCTILQQSKAGSIVAVTPRFADEFSSSGKRFAHV